MSWKKVKISSFLTERKDRFKPDVANELGLKRIHKIDFSGNIYILEKLTNTGMILVKKGDLVISGINVEKGALAVYEGQEEVLATIHYSSYKYDKDKIDVDYLKWFLKSNLFKTILLEQVGGGIKTELKPKRFLPLEINLPDLKTQIEIKNKILAVEKEIEEIENKIGKESFYLTKLKESILQEAVQGKLVEQNPEDEPASVLLEKIKKEKEQLIKDKNSVTRKNSFGSSLSRTIKKEKPLPEITQDEIPYELPNGWEWCRLGNILRNIDYGTSEKTNDIDKIPIFRMGNINNNGQLLFFNFKYLPSTIDDLPRLYLQKFDLLFNRTNSYELVGKTGIFENEDDKYSFASYLIRLKLFLEYLNPYYINNYLNSIIFRKTQIEPQIIQQCGQANFNGTKLKNTLIPLPPLEEQKRIVKKIDTLMTYCDDLEQEINNSKRQAEQLMQSVLKEAFEQKEELLV